MNDLVTNINQVASDFNNIKQAIINKGVEVPQGTPTSQYGELIGNICGNGDNTDDTILLNMPLTSDLSDISGFNRIATYSGATPLTITEDNGLYLGKSVVDINGRFLPERFAVDFNLKIEADSTTSDRPIISLYGGSYGIAVYVTSTAAYDDFNNGLKIITYEATKVKSAIIPTLKSYADGAFHHIIMHYDKTSNFVCVTIDNSDQIAMRFSNGIANTIRLGRSNAQVLNGYIKNLIIKK